MLDELFFRINTSVETIVNVGIAIATATTLRIWKSVSKGDSVKMNSVNNPLKEIIKDKKTNKPDNNSAPLKEMFFCFIFVSLCAFNLWVHNTLKIKYCQVILYK